MPTPKYKQAISKTLPSWAATDSVHGVFPPQYTDNHSKCWVFFKELSKCPVEILMPMWVISLRLPDISLLSETDAVFLHLYPNQHNPRRRSSILQDGPISSATFPEEERGTAAWAAYSTHRRSKGPVFPVPVNSSALIASP